MHAVPTYIEDAYENRRFLLLEEKKKIREQQEKYSRASSQKSAYSGSLFRI